MRIERVDPAVPKGWLAGPWNSAVPVSVGFATQAIDDPHVHDRVTEIFLVARGSATARVRSENVEIGAGDVLFVEPGEPHTFLRASEDALLYVVHAPGLEGEEASLERRSVLRSELGL